MDFCYFGYGSNMDLNSLRAGLSSRVPQCESVHLALLDATEARRFPPPHKFRRDAIDAKRKLRFEYWSPLPRGANPICFAWCEICQIASEPWRHFGLDFRPEFPSCAT
jgi:hypothetical protein